MTLKKVSVLRSRPSVLHLIINGETLVGMKLDERNERKQHDFEQVCLQQNSEAAVSCHTVYISNKCCNNDIQNVKPAPRFKSLVFRRKSVKHDDKNF